MSTIKTPDTDLSTGVSVCAEAVTVVDGGVDLLLNTLRLAEADPVTACLSEPGQVRAVLAGIEKTQRKLAAARLRLIEQGRRVQAPERSGFAGAGAWVARTTDTGSTQARRQAGLAQDLPQVPATRAALEAGELSEGHAEVITDALHKLPDHLSAEERMMVEQRLMRLAGQLDPGRLRRQARRALEVVVPDPVVVDEHENQLVEAEEDQAASAASFWLHDNHDGTVTGHFVVPALAGLVLGKILDAMTAPRRKSGSAPAQRQIAEKADWKLNKLEWQHKRGLAFAELLERLPTDHLHGKVAATVLVHADHAALQGSLKVASTDGAVDVSAGQVRRLACEAGIIPMVLGTDSVVLDQGAATRLHTEAQRIALSAQYEECAAEGCDRPFAWCEIHHLTPWARAKRTSIDDAVPLCGTHHREIDRPGTTHTVRAGPKQTVSIRFHRRT